VKQVSSAIALGVDAGSTTFKLVAADTTGALLLHAIEPASPRLEEQAHRLLQAARSELGQPDARVVATGYGRKLVPADRAVTEITCHATGVYRRLGALGTLIDIGGQDSKVISIGPGGTVLDFAMNDKCAAGTGRFLEVTAQRLEVPIDQMGPTALGAQREVAISSTCTVFAESEIVGLIAHAEPLESIVRGLHRSLVSRIVSLAKSIGSKPPFMLSGGVAKNEAVRRFLADALGADVRVPEQPQLMGAYGAALLALRAP
jgi:(R)-2-hydroxyacyl-CoA dehydratese activating ATPase